MAKTKEQKRQEAIERKRWPLLTAEARLNNALECYYSAPSDFRKREMDSADMALRRLRVECGLTAAPTTEKHDDGSIQCTDGCA